MPRKPRSASRPAAKASPAAQRDSSEEATSSKKRPSKQAATPKAAKAPKTPVAERVTRRSTRPAATKRPVYSDASESDEEEVVPKKRGRQSSPRKGPAASRGRGRPSTKDTKKKGRSPRKSRKRDSDEESEESLDLGESEEEEEPEDDDEEEAPVSKTVRGPPARRGARGGTRSTDDAVSRGGIGADKTSPSVMLERVEGGAKGKGSKTPARGRPARSPRAAAATKGRRRGRAADSEEEEEENEDDDEEGSDADDAPVTKPSAGTSSRPQRGARTPASKPAVTKAPTATPRRRGAPRKMVPSEENAATLAAADKEEGGEGEEEVAAVKKDAGSDDKEIDADEAVEKKEPVADSSDEKKADAKKEEEEQSDEAMDVDAPEKEKKPADDDAADSKSESPKKHKLDDEVLPPAKRARTEEEKVEESETASSTADAKANDVADGAATSKADEKKESDAAVNGSELPKDDVKDAEPKVNGDTATPATTNSVGADHESMMSASLGVPLPRRCVTGEGVTGDGERFSLVSYNLAYEDWSSKHASLVAEVVALRPSILCLQEVDEAYFKSSLDSALKSHGYMGLYKPGRTPAKGLATFYLLSAFEILHHKELEVHDLLDKDVQASNLSDSEKDAVKSFLLSPAPVLITKLKSVSNGKSVTVGTIHLPSDDESLLAVQVSAVVRELLSVSEGSANPHVLCGSFNLDDDSAVQQLLKDGSLKSEVLEELKKKATVPIPEKENVSLAELLAASFQHPSSCLKSSYGSILGHEFKFPDKNQKLSRDSLWYSSDSLSTNSILDAGPPADSVTAPTSGVHVSLKAELGFVN